MLRNGCFKSGINFTRFDPLLLVILFLSKYISDEPGNGRGKLVYEFVQQYAIQLIRRGRQQQQAKDETSFRHISTAASTRIESFYP